MRNLYSVTLKPNKHRHKKFRHLIFASDDVESRPRVIKYVTNNAIVLAVIFALIFGCFVGFVVYKTQSDMIYAKKIADRDAKIEELSSENMVLSAEIASLNDKVLILSDTVNTKSASEAELAETLEAQWVPSDFPLTGGASFVEVSDPEPMCVFSGSEGIMAVATAAGTIVEIGEDEEFGNVIIIDHDNGYRTVYKNKGDVMVREGDHVTQGTTLYIINSGNTTLGYQILEGGEYINPLDVLEING